MKKEEIISVLQKKIANEILNMPEKLIAPDESIISSGLIDSFSLVDLALLVEDNFNIQIEDTELNADIFDSIYQLAELISTRKI